MRRTNFLFLFATIIFCACEGEVIDTDKGGGNSPHLRAEIKRASRTRVTNSTWEKNDAIGVFMVQSGKSIEEGQLRYNVKYVNTGSSSFEPSNSDEEITFPFDQSEVDFISYYPYKDNINDAIYPIDVRNQSKQSEIDLLYSNNARGHNSENKDVDMQFIHQLSKIILKISTDKDMDLTNLSIILSNAPLSANFNLSTGELSTATERGDIAFSMAKDGLQAEAILLPGEITPDIKLWFIVENDYADKVFQIPLPEALDTQSLAKSTQYTCNANLSYETVSISTEDNITTWTENPAVNKTVNRTDDAPPIVKGSKDTPFTVEESIVNQGRTNVWVEGYIVGSFDKSRSNFKPGATDAATTNVAIADTPNETDVNKIIAVLFPSITSIRNELDLTKNPGNIGKKVLIRGNLASIFSGPGLKDLVALDFP